MTANFEGFSYQPELSEESRDVERYAKLYALERPMTTVALHGDFNDGKPLVDTNRKHLGTDVYEECMDDLLDDPRFGHLAS